MCVGDIIMQQLSIPLFQIYTGSLISPRVSEYPVTQNPK